MNTKNQSKNISQSKKDSTKSVEKNKKETTDKTSKVGSAKKSASQLSISHFSSVSTPEYREGWERIWGGKTSGDSLKKIVIPIPFSQMKLFLQIKIFQKILNKKF